jgi:hypothetical protein
MRPSFSRKETAYDTRLLLNQSAVVCGCKFPSATHACFTLINPFHSTFRALFGVALLVPLAELAQDLRPIRKDPKLTPWATFEQHCKTFPHGAIPAKMMN